MWRISGSRKVDVLKSWSIWVYMPLALTQPFLVKIHVQHIIFICVIFVYNIMSNGFISSRNTMKYHEMPPLCPSPIRFSSQRPFFDLASTSAPASRSICITLVLPFNEACHSGVQPWRNKKFVTQICSDWIIWVNEITKLQWRMHWRVEIFWVKICKLFSSTGFEKISEVFPCKLCSLPEFIIQQLHPMVHGKAAP